MGANLPRHGPKWCPDPQGPAGWARAFLASLVLFQVSAGTAAAADRWRPYPTVGVLEGVTLRVRWFEDIVELRKAAKDTG
jgi:hypothetical protein